MPRQICCFLALILVIGGAGILRAQVVISGKVVEANSTSAGGSYVYAIPMDITNAKGVVGSGSGAWTQTDADGNFRLSLSPGRYRIIAKDESKGYPDPSFLLNSDPSGTFPFVSAEHDILSVVVKLGQQGGVLTGIVKSQSGRPLPQAQIKVRDPRNNAFAAFFTDKNGRFLFAVPPKPVVVTAEAEGFMRTEYENGAKLSLSGGQTRTVVFELAPIGD